MEHQTTPEVEPGSRKASKNRVTYPARHVFNEFKANFQA